LCVSVTYHVSPVYRLIERYRSVHAQVRHAVPAPNAASSHFGAGIGKSVKR
jgi:hypothetical protein